jgi:hypothetical protein
MCHTYVITINRHREQHDDPHDSRRNSDRIGVSVCQKTEIYNA